MEILKNTVTENTVTDVKKKKKIKSLNRLDQAQGRISELKDRILEILQSEE